MRVRQIPASALRENGGCFTLLEERACLPAAGPAKEGVRSSFSTALACCSQAPRSRRNRALSANRPPPHIRRVLSPFTIHHSPFPSGSQTRLPPRRLPCHCLRFRPVGTVPAPIRAPEGMFDLESLAAFSGSAVVSTASVGVPPAESFVQNWPAYWVSPQAHRL